MTKFCSGKMDTPTAWLLIISVTIVGGICIGAVTMWDVLKEIVVVTAVTLVPMSVLGRRVQGIGKKNCSKAFKDEYKVVAFECPQQDIIPEETEVPKAAAVVASQDSRQLSKRPVLPPTFLSTSFDDQAEELSQQLLPTERCQKLVQDIAQDVKKIILNVLPYADVVGFANAEVSRGTAYGVAVPEVDVVVNLPPHILVRTLQAHISNNNFSGKVDDRRLHKSGLRMCTDLLVTSGGFKFRRSAFRGRDPKVTLMAPRLLDDSGCIPIDFSVNAATPLCNSVLINASARVDPRARMLILLVKRWAKDRGICHAAKGHLMPYAWTLLCIYFLQVGVKGGSILPPFKHLRLAPGQDKDEVAGLAQCMQGWSAPTPGSALAKKRLGQLFKEFVHFYLVEVDWRSEVASIRTGTRAPPHRTLRLHIVDTATGATVCPNIEDPFMPSENMSEMLTANGLTRLGEELARVQACFDSNTPLSEILTQWVPPEQRSQKEEADLNGSMSGDEADLGKGTVAIAPEEEAVTEVAPAPSSVPVEQKEFPVPPWRKRPPASAQAKTSASLPKQNTTLPQRPPGTWGPNGKSQMACPTPQTSQTAA